MDELLGKKAHSKVGFTAGMVGIVESNDFITDYKIVFPDGGAVGVVKENIVLVDSYD